MSYNLTSRGFQNTSTSEASGYSSNTPGTVVKRDENGDFTAGVISVDEVTVDGTNVKTTLTAHTTSLTDHETRIGDNETTLGTLDTAPTISTIAQRDFNANLFANFFVGELDGNAATVTTIPTLSGEVSDSGNTITLNNADVIGKALTGFVAGAGSVSDTDSLLSATEKLVGNVDAIETTISGYSTKINTALVDTTGTTIGFGSSATITTANIAAGNNINTINLGGGATTKTINLGIAGDTVAVPGTLTTVDTTNLAVTDKTITLNNNGLAGSGAGVGINVEEAGAATGYWRVNPTRDAILMRAPASAEMSFNQSLMTTAPLTTPKPQKL